MEAAVADQTGLGPGTYKVEMDAPLFNRVKEEKEKKAAEVAAKEEKDKQYLNSLLSKYQRDDLINHLNEKILEESKSYGDTFNISDIKNVLITLSELSSYSKVFFSCKVDIYLNDGKVKTITNTYLYTSGKIGITKKDLKTLGGKDGVPF